MSKLIDKTKYHCEMFGISTGVKIRYIPCDDNGDICDVCKKLGLPGCPSLASKSVAVSNRLRSGYCFMCPLGFAIFCSPVRNKDGLVGGYFSSPLLLDDLSSYVDDICLHNSGVNIKKLEKILTSLNTVSCERLRYLLELLYLTTTDFDAESAVADYLSKERSTSEKEINEEVQQLKMGNETVDSKLFTEVENELIEAITSKDYIKSRHTLNKLLGHIFYVFGRNFTALKIKCVEVVSLISRTHNDGIQSFAFSKSTLEKILSADNYDRLCDYLNNALKQFFSLAEEETPLTQTIAMAKRYIKENIFSLLSLKEVSDYVYLSPAYFSRVFRLQTGTTFSEYVTSCKIDKVKRLLSTTNLSVAEIAHKLQFADQSYMTKVFKKKTGKTPLNWKKTN